MRVPACIALLTALFKEDSIMNKMKQLSHDYLTINEVKDYLNISQSKAYELAHRNAFPICRFDGSIRIPKDSFLAWIETRTLLPGGLMPGA
jgi:excisionase family DNA binding protein